MKVQDAVNAIKAKGYIVIEKENLWLGKLDEACPLVYDILYPDYSNVYGANAIGPEQLTAWVNNLAECKAKNTQPPHLAKSDSKKEKEWDNIYNEGGEGYNPYR